MWRAIGRLQGPFLQKFTTPRIAGRIKNLYECISGDETDEHKIAYTALLHLMEDELMLRVGAKEKELEERIKDLENQQGLQAKLEKEEEQRKLFLTEERRRTCTRKRAHVGYAAVPRPVGLGPTMPPRGPVPLSRGAKSAALGKGRRAVDGLKRKRAAK